MVAAKLSKRSFYMLFFRVNAHLPLLFKYLSSTMSVIVSFRISEPSGPSEWLVNISLPTYAQPRFHGWSDLSEDDLVVVRHDSPGWEVYDQIISRASSTMGCQESEVLALYDKKRSFSWSDSPLHDLGFYNCCTVSVEQRDGWVLFLEVAGRCNEGNPLRNNPIMIDPVDDCNFVNQFILNVASHALQCSTDDLYVLFNGTPLRRSRDGIDICQLGIRNNSTLTVFRRLKGGVCIAQNASGRKRSVSSIQNMLFSVSSILYNVILLLFIKTGFSKCWISPNFGISDVLANYVLGIINQSLLKKARRNGKQTSYLV